MEILMALLRRLFGVVLFKQLIVGDEFCDGRGEIWTKVEDVTLVEGDIPLHGTRSNAVSDKYGSWFFPDDGYVLKSGLGMRFYRWLAVRARATT